MCGCGETGPGGTGGGNEPSLGGGPRPLFFSSVVVAPKSSSKNIFSIFAELLSRCRAIAGSLLPRALALVRFYSLLSSALCFSALSTHWAIALSRSDAFALWLVCAFAFWRSDAQNFRARDALSFSCVVAVVALSRGPSSLSIQILLLGPPLLLSNKVCGLRSAVCCLRFGLGYAVFAVWFGVCGVRFAV